MATLLFDLDGTLIDSALGITRCAAYAFEQLGETVPDDATLRSWIGPALRVSFAPLLKDEARVERAVELYRERYDTHGWCEHTVYEGIPEAIESLHASGHRLAVVTAKNEPHARKILKSLPFGHRFVEIVGATLDGRLSHKPELIAEALQRLDSPAGECTMIGDRHMDMEGAVHHGMRGLGVLWGFGDEAELRGAGARAVLRHPAELRELAA
ncbi:HAD hydrolase-like protein [Cognatilysobacter lacus]|uniref:HAD hydrolase-like protein n=1 Tax=Cognatilysobacter lacus TaxID=1643323 RepID=A0A5D8ZDE5_9GAMM|nr:HAD hydrolase-like protein [Lysobacter lacus]TZF90664.1 HAD hydrolase-like protein [Lysobacter lacus]